MSWWQTSANVPADQKKEVGMKLKWAEKQGSGTYPHWRKLFETQDNGAAEMDLYPHGYPIELGTRHPLSNIKNEMLDFPTRLGFSIADGPEIEDDSRRFSSMNFAEDHPARYAGYFLRWNQPWACTGQCHLRTPYFIRTKPGNGKRSHPSELFVRGAYIATRAISYRAHAFSIR